jgi:hypothetical protein
MIEAQSNGEEHTMDDGETFIEALHTLSAQCAALHTMEVPVMYVL